LLKQRHNRYMALSAWLSPQFNDDNSLTLIFSFAFHQKRMNEAGNQKRWTLLPEKSPGHSVKLTALLALQNKQTWSPYSHRQLQSHRPTEDLTCHKQYIWRW